MTFWKLIQLNKCGLKIPHLIFVDDLIIFVEAFPRQINSKKTKIHLCNNVHENVRHQISEDSNFHRTCELGKYLRVPLNTINKNYLQRRKYVVIYKESYTNKISPYEPPKLHYSSQDPYATNLLKFTQ
ncbi:hypothetical protein CR513_03553, partial [Mucuna pruriens]